MAKPNTIAASIDTLKAKGYSDQEIQNIQFSVPEGDNRRATALFNAARDLPSKPQPQPAPPPAPKPIQPPTPPQTISSENAGSRLKINKKARRTRKGSGRGTDSLRISLNASPQAAASGGVNLGGS